MSAYWIEGIIAAIQLFMFYIFPLFAGPTDAMGMIFLILLTTFLLSIAMGICSGRRLKFFYPLFVSALFVPSVFIHYNTSALIHAGWYFADACIGLCIGLLLRLIFRRR